MRYLETLNREMWISFQQGAFLGKETEQAKALGAMELGSRLVHLDSDDMVKELCHDIQNDKNNE